jgi:hypothetical protein
MAIEIKHRFTGAVLHTVEADTLSKADLARADLSGANLYGATIDADKLDRLLARATRVIDGHEFFLFALQEGPSKVKAGCRWMAVADYRAHVAANYPDTSKARETLNILDYFTKVQKDALSISNS